MMLSVCTLLFLLAGVTGKHVTSSGTEGNVCSKDNKRICPPEETVCKDGHCTCADGFGGVPGLQCKTTETKLLCTLTNDPVASTFNGQRADSPVPCNILLAEASRTRVTDSCEIKLFAHNKRVKGKVYPAGFEAQVTYKSKITGQTYTRGYKATGTGADGVYEYDLYISKSPTVRSSYVDEWNPNDYKIWMFPFTFEVDTDTNRVNLNMKNTCGFVVKFRAADESVDVLNQPGIPGVSIMLDDDVGVTTGTEAVCMDIHPVSDYLPMNRGITSEFIRRSYNEDAPQDFPNASDKCADTSLFDICGDDEEKLSISLNDCAEVFAEPPFIKCYSGNDDPKSDRILELFRSCVNMVCSGTTCPAGLKTAFADLTSTCLSKVPPSVQSCKP